LAGSAFFATSCFLASTGLAASGFLASAGLSAANSPPVANPRPATIAHPIRHTDFIINLVQKTFAATNGRAARQRGI
jgi:hypothetical protein